MTSSESWTDIVCKSLENVDKIYGKVVGTTPPLSEDEPICIVYKVNDNLVRIICVHN